MYNKKKNPKRRSKFEMKYSFELTLKLVNFHLAKPIIIALWF